MMNKQRLQIEEEYEAELVNDAEYEAYLDELDESHEDVADLDAEEYDAWLERQGWTDLTSKETSRDE